MVIKWDDLSLISKASNVLFWGAGEVALLPGFEVPFPLPDPPQERGRERGVGGVVCVMRKTWKPIERGEGL